MRRILQTGFFLGMLLFISVANAQIPTSGLVAYYPFNGNANDSSGNGNNGTNHGATLATDRFGNSNSAYSFDGVSSYIDCGNGTSLKVANDITVAAWIKSGFSTDQSPEVASKYGTNKAGWILTTYPDSTAAFEGRDTTGVYIQSGKTTKFDGGWHFILGQRVGSVWKIYLDGQLKSQYDAGTKGVWWHRTISKSGFNREPVRVSSKARLMISVYTITI